MEEYIDVHSEVSVRGVTVAFESGFRIQKGQQGFITLDFGRKFEDPDLDKLPAKWIVCYTPEQAYMIRKHEVILGEFGDLW